MDRLPERITFHPEIETMEADFSDLLLNDPASVEFFYDAVEECIRQSGRDKWFFLVNYRNCRIMPEAWLAHSLRGKRLNLTHSLGTVRFDASPETRAEIARRAGTEDFDANLFDNREAALARVAEMRAARPARKTRRPATSQYPQQEFERRVRFIEDLRIMDVDFSDFAFDSNADVNAFYDHLEARIAATGQPKWYFLVNYRNCSIDLRAWISFSQRGKHLNEAHSLGSVRYDAGSVLAEEIRAQAARKNFDPNLCVTREEALERIAALQASGNTGAQANRIGGPSGPRKDSQPAGKRMPGDNGMGRNG